MAITAPTTTSQAIQRHRGDGSWPSGKTSGRAVSRSTVPGNQIHVWTQAARSPPGSALGSVKVTNQAYCSLNRETAQQSEPARTIQPTRLPGTRMASRPPMAGKAMPAMTTCGRNPRGAARRSEGSGPRRAL